MGKLISRLTKLLFLLVPVTMGLLGVFNDIAGYKEALSTQVSPLVKMAYVPVSEQWRALTDDTVISLFYNFIIIGEGLCGVVTLLGIFLLLKNIRASREKFNHAKWLASLGCIIGILVWGVGFMGVANDWFLAWQTTQFSGVDLGAFLYVGPIALSLIYLNLDQE